MTMIDQEFKQRVDKLGRFVINELPTRVQVNARFTRLDGTIAEINSKVANVAVGVVEFREEMNQRIDRVENRMEAMENRMEAMENRMEAMENRMEAMENRMEAMENRIDTRMEAMQGQLATIIDRLPPSNGPEPSPP